MNGWIETRPLYQNFQDPSFTILWNSYRSFKTVFKRNLAVFCQKKHSIITASLNGSKQRLLRFCGSSFAVPLLLLDVTSMYLLRKLAEEDLKWKYAFLAAQVLFGLYNGVEVGMQLMLMIVKRPCRIGPTTTQNHCSLERKMYSAEWRNGRQRLSTISSAILQTQIRTSGFWNSAFSLPNNL